MMTYNNPIISGFYPDPSVCKKDDRYYMVCSSFNYFPGVPLFESVDLINWTPIGNVLTKPEQLDLTGEGNAGGIYAPTIRCHNGRFYMVTTHVSKKHFFVYTDDIYGEWSDPVWVNQEGIDPSLYFERDTVYFMSNGHDKEGKPAVLQCEIDIETGKKRTETKVIWHGTGGRYLEAPHLYLINDTYYLLASEGGTEYGHMVVYATSHTPYGPFKNAPHNPILTNRDLGGYPIQGAGHGDLIQDNDGNWWLPHLAFRPQGPYENYHHLGREVYLVPMSIYPNGKLTTDTNGITPTQVTTTKLPPSLVQQPLPIYTFDEENWHKEWLFLRNPDKQNYQITKGQLHLYPSTTTLNDTTYSPTFIALRQRSMDGKLSVKLTAPQGEAGITLYMNETHHYEFALINTGSNITLIKRRTIGDMTFIAHCQQLDTDTVTLHITFDKSHYHFKAATQNALIDFGSAQVKYLSKEVADGFTGVVMGLYAQTEVATKTPPATFTNFYCEFKQ